MGTTEMRVRDSDNDWRLVYRIEAGRERLRRHDAAGGVEEER
jgi:hypothetical protein